MWYKISENSSNKCRDLMKHNEKDARIGKQRARSGGDDGGCGSRNRKLGSDG